MFYDYTQNPPRIFVDEGEGHIVDARVIDAIPIFEKKRKIMTEP